MIKHYCISNLHRGMGAVMGCFVRNSYLVQNEDWKVVGVRIGDLNVFSTIPDSTDTVMDVTMKLSQMKFVFDEEAAKRVPGVEVFSADGEYVYKVPFYLTGSELNTDGFGDVLKVHNPSTILKLLYAPAEGLCVTLYFRKAVGVASEEINKSILVQVEKDMTGVVALASTSTPNSKVYYKVVDTGTKEDLLFTFEGHEEDFEKFKTTLAETLQRIITEFIA